MTNDELLVWAAEARQRARRAGTLSPLWDLIFEAEALAKGERTLLQREEVERAIRETDCWSRSQYSNDEIYR